MYSFKWQLFVLKYLAIFWAMIELDDFGHVNFVQKGLPISFNP